MSTAATHHEQRTTTEFTLFVAFELSEKTWKASPQGMVKSRVSVL